VGKGLRDFRRALSDAQDAVRRLPEDAAPDRDDRGRLSD
jgi:hypothetical protein